MEVRTSKGKAEVKAITRKWKIQNPLEGWKVKKKDHDMRNTPTDLNVREGHG